LGRRAEVTRFRGQEFGVGQSRWQPRQAPRQQRLGHRDPEVLVARRGQDPVGPSQVLPVPLPVRLVTEVIDPRRETILELGEGRRDVGVLPAEDRPPQVQPLAVALGDFQELLRPLVVLPAVRPDHPYRFAFAGLPAVPASLRRRLDRGPDDAAPLLDLLLPVRQLHGARPPQDPVHALQERRLVPGAVPDDQVRRQDAGEVGQGEVDVALRVDLGMVRQRIRRLVLVHVQDDGR
jgi:hypothetical protein